MDTKIKELRAKMAAAYASQQALQKKADDEKRDLTGEELAKWNEADADFEKFSDEVKRRESMEARQKELAAPVDPTPARETRNRIPTGAGRQNDDHEMTEEELKQVIAKEKRTFETWIRYGVNGLDQEERSILMALKAKEKFDRRDLQNQPELRALSIVTGSAGQFTIPQGFSNELETLLKAFGGMRSVSRILATSSGNDLPWPTVDDTSNSGELLAENTGAATGVDPTFAQIIFKAYKYSSKIVQVPLELLQDSGFNVSELLQELLSTRIGRINNTHFTVGTGTGQPKGVVVEAGSGKVGLTGQTLSVIYDDIIDLEHSIDPAYRPGSSYMFADSTLKVLKKIKDTTGRPIWLPGLNSGLSDQINGPTLNGYNYVINQDIAAMAANAKSIVFGNFKKYVIRDVMAMTLLRLEERYADLGQVGFILFSRTDGRSINANSLKYYQNSAT